MSVLDQFWLKKIMSTAPLRLPYVVVVGRIVQSQWTVALSLINVINIVTLMSMEITKINAGAYFVFYLLLYDENNKKVQSESMWNNVKIKIGNVPFYKIWTC